MMKFEPWQPEASYSGDINVYLISNQGVLGLGHLEFVIYTKSAKHFDGEKVVQEGDLGVLCTKRIFSDYCWFDLDFDGVIL